MCPSIRPGDYNGRQIGYPVTGMQFEVRGDDAQPVQPGTAGEIVVRSRFLATGYWKNAAATERAFEAAGPGSLERLYRTGDRGRIDDHGRLEFLGRLDGRARVRGQWVELADVDAAVAALPGVREATVAAVGTDDSNTRLVASVASATAGSWPTRSPACWRRKVNRSAC